MRVVKVDRNGLHGFLAHNGNHLVGTLDVVKTEDLSTTASLPILHVYISEKYLSLGAYFAEKKFEMPIGDGFGRFAIDVAELAFTELFQTPPKKFEKPIGDEFLRFAIDVVKLFQPPPQKSKHEHLWLEKRSDPYYGVVFDAAREVIRLNTRGGLPSSVSRL